MARSVLVAWILIAASVALGIYWASDRTPPFELLLYKTTPAKPGGTVYVEAKVHRDLSRGCSVRFTRHIFDSTGRRFDLSDEQVLDAESIEMMDKLAPGALRLAFKVPETMLPGPAKQVSALRYYCNPLHNVWPIRVLLTYDFMVLS